MNPLLPTIVLLRHAGRLGTAPLETQQAVGDGQLQVLDLGARQLAGEQIFVIELVQVHSGELRSKADPLKRKVHAVEKLIDFALQVLECVPGMSPAKKRHEAVPMRPA